MLFEKDHIYHIYNQGNDRQKIFYERKNYLFFLQKMKDYLLPFCDVMAWCLMPNHFHWMVYVRETEVDCAGNRGATLSRTPTGTPISSNLNQAIGIMLSSYTRAINIQQNRTGSLFRQKTKAECITKPQGISPSCYNLGFATSIRIDQPEKEYPQVCFNYIHQNPVKKGLVKNPEDWEFSSFRDFCGLRNGQLISRQRVDEFGLIVE